MRGLVKSGTSSRSQSRVSNTEKIRELKLLERRRRLRAELPHLYGLPHYQWSLDFMESTNKECFLTAANQIGKSTVQIRKVIHWATAVDLWPKLWKTKPNLFWYLYPTRDVATEEFKLKWEALMPQGSMKNDPKYGWKAFYDKKLIRYLEFNSGVNVYFKTYSQNVQDLQTGTVYGIFCDEELPVEQLPELQARVNATDGYFSLVFTATLGQEHWRKTMEPKTSKEEKHKGAWKRSVSLYDCVKYADGSLGTWSKDKIQRAVNKCPTQNEVMRRIYGKFVKSTGLKYPSFDVKRNVSVRSDRKANWNVYAAVDIGSGGVDAHPAAIAFAAVSPCATRAEVFKTWRGDGVKTTVGDILNKYLEMSEGLNVVLAAYDWASADFYTVAQRAGVPFARAQKSHELGENLVNTAFKYGMLKIISGAYDNDKLVDELTSLDVNTRKQIAKDDLADALRYLVCELYLDYSKVLENDIDFAKKVIEAKGDPKELSFKKDSREEAAERCALGLYGQKNVTLDRDLLEYQREIDGK